MGEASIKLKRGPAVAVRLGLASLLAPFEARRYRTPAIGPQSYARSTVEIHINVGFKGYADGALKTCTRTPRQAAGEEGKLP